MPNIDLSTRSNKKYLSISKHQKNARNHHSKWKTIDLEIETFNNGDKGSLDGSDKESWLCTSSLWGFCKASNSIKIVGTEKQQFGYFDIPRNTTDHWHGFPVIPFKKQGETRYDICKSLLDEWVKEKVLTADEVAILTKGRLL